ALALGEIKDSRAVEFMVSALEDKDLAIVAGAYAFFIRQGVPGSEDILMNALNEHGYEVMAEDFLTCGNSELEEAAHKWALENESEIKPAPGSKNSPLWGSSRKLYLKNSDQAE
ncbi:MAG: hypothetical protein HYV00_03500, partial [Deltaproteobacteria bacterium]|nr:hypothetical protein [Deltaproteobacteria bacterium]